MLKLKGKGFIRIAGEAQIDILDFLTGRFAYFSSRGQNAAEFLSVAVQQSMVLRARQQADSQVRCSYFTNKVSFRLCFYQMKFS